MINSVTLVGRLTADPVIKETTTGKNLCEIVLALNRPYKNPSTHQNEADFIRCIMWESLAINVNEYCKKGATIGVRGRLQTRTVKVENVNIQIIEVIGEQLVFISRPGDKLNANAKDENPDQELAEQIENCDELPL